MLLSEIKVFHGTDKAHKALRPPIFVTTNKSGARWYAVERGAGNKGVILHGELNIKKALDARHDFDAVYELADAAGIKYKTRPYFQCAEIAKHSQYDGSNPSDLVYIPAFVKQLKKAGYDCIHMYDVLTNDEIDTYVLFDTKQFKVEGEETAESEEDDE